VPLDAVRLLPPLTPPTVRDFVAFEEHVEGIAGQVVPEWYQAPTFYFTNPYALIGAHDDVRVPPGCEMLDFELEVAVVVGRDGASLSAEQARDHIFGYTVLNDWSARDLQRREMKVMLGPAKGKDFASTLGPWLVTADELEPYRDSDGFLALDLRASVNGELIGQDLLSNMGWPFEELIAYASRGTEVRAGRHRRADRRRDRDGAQPRGAGAYAATGTRSTRPFGTPGEKAGITSGLPHTRGGDHLQPLSEAVDAKGTAPMPDERVGDPANRESTVDGRHLLLVGAGPGLGTAVARRFAVGGYRITLMARSTEGLRDLAGTVADTGAEISTVAADASDPDSLGARMRELYAGNGAPGVIVYNAVMGAPDRLLSSSVAHLQAAYSVDVISAIVVAQVAAPAMRAAGFGTILVTGGGFADHPIPALATVSLGKAALRSAATMLGADLEADGIRVATLTIAGQIAAGTSFDPERIAERYWEVVHLDGRWQAEFRFTGE